MSDIKAVAIAYREQRMRALRKSNGVDEFVEKWRRYIPEDLVATLLTDADYLANKNWMSGCSNGTRNPWREDMGT